MGEIAALIGSITGLLALLGTGVGTVRLWREKQNRRLEETEQKKKDLQEAADAKRHAEAAAIQEQRVQHWKDYSELLLRENERLRRRLDEKEQA